MGLDARLKRLEKRTTPTSEMVEIEGMQITRAALKKILNEISGHSTGLSDNAYG